MANIDAFLLSRVNLLVHLSLGSLGLVWFSILQSVRPGTPAMWDDLWEKTSVIKDVWTTLVTVSPLCGSSAHLNRLKALRNPMVDKPNIHPSEVTLGFGRETYWRGNVRAGVCPVSSMLAGWGNVRSCLLPGFICNLRTCANCWLQWTLLSVSHPLACWHCASSQGSAVFAQDLLTRLKLQQRVQRILCCATSSVDLLPCCSFTVIEGHVGELLWS